MAPLRRAAERLADRVVPIAGTHGEEPPRAADVYRRAVRLALRDRRLTRNEEIELAHLAHELGLSAPQAARILRDVEQEGDSAREGARGDGDAAW